MIRVPSQDAALADGEHPRHVERSLLHVTAIEDEVSSAADGQTADVVGAQNERATFGRRNQRLAVRRAERAPRLELPPDRARLKLQRRPASDPIAIGELAEYRLAHSARADLLRRLGRAAEARTVQDRARSDETEPERRFLERRLRELDPS